MRADPLDLRPPPPEEPEPGGSPPPSGPPSTSHEPWMPEEQNMGTPAPPAGAEPPGELAEPRPQADPAPGAPPAPPAPTAGQPTLCGFLLKRGGPLKTWKRRWFSYEEPRNQLLYFRTPQDVMSLGRLSLCGATFSLPPEAHSAVFHIHTPQRTFTLKVGCQANPPHPTPTPDPC